jgi:16S rRNA (uracil1498-N3)-methyltransferase
MNIFYAPDAAANTLIQLNEEEAHHAAHVLRIKAGETIRVFNGTGSAFNAVVVTVGKREVSVQVKGQLADAGSSNMLHIAIAPTKQMERYEWFLEKATELGIAEITPIICTRSERKEVKAERLQKVILSACKQSLRYQLPKLNMAVPLAGFLKDNPKGLMAHLEDSTVDIASLEDKFKGKPFIILIGPEGDFTKEEIALAKEQGYTSVTLGKARLRTETAGIFAAAIAKIWNEK